MSDTRYPYTYAADLIRIIAGHNGQGSKLSRSDAAAIRATFSTVLGLPDEFVASKLADYYKANEEALTAVAADKVVASLTDIGVEGGR